MQDKHVDFCFCIFRNHIQMLKAKWMSYDKVFGWGGLWKVLGIQWRSLNMHTPSRTSRCKLSIYLLTTSSTDRMWHKISF